MSYFLKKLLTALILPPGSLLPLLLWGCWRLRRGPGAAGFPAILAALGASLVLALPPVADWLSQSLDQAPPISAQALAQCEALVVLGGDWRHERVMLAARLQRLVDLPILVSGGTGFGGHAESPRMRQLIEDDLGGRVRWVEIRSRDTQENAEYAWQMLQPAGIRHIALVTDSWHMRRAAALFRRIGFEVTPAPVPPERRGPWNIGSSLPSADALAESSRALHEWLGALVDEITPKPPAPP